MVTDSFKAFVSYTEGRKSQRTTEAYIYIVNRYLRDCKGTVNRDTAIAFINSFEVNERSPQTIRAYFAALRYYFKYLGKTDELKGYEMPRLLNPKMEAITKEQLTSILSRCWNLKEKAMVVLLYDCALRIGELITIDVEDIGQKEGYLAVHTEKKRTTDDNPDQVPISDNTVELLKGYMTKYGITAGRLFPGLKYITALHNIQRIGERCGITGLKTHSFRHARATHLAEDDIPGLKLQAFMRHARFTTTQKYIHITDQSVKDSIPPAFDGPLTKVKKPSAEVG